MNLPHLDDAIVPVPSLIIDWRPERNRRSRHWPMPDPCADLNSYIVYWQLDVPELDVDGLRDQRALSRYLLGSLLAHRGSRVAEHWLRERLAAIADERQRRRPATTRAHTRATGEQGQPAPAGFQPVRGGRAS